MNLHQIIGELRAELDAVTEVLTVLDRLARVQGKRKGRPPLLLVQDLEKGATLKRRRFSEETKKKMAAAQKKRWANYRKQKQSGKS